MRKYILIVFSFISFNTVAQWQYVNPTTLSNSLNASLLQTSVVGRTGGNNFYNNAWLYGTSANNDWTTTKYVDGISIDASFNTPTTARSWWLRDPVNNVQSWGDQGSTYLTINQGNVGIGTSSPTDQLEVVNGNRKIGFNTLISGVSPGGILSLSRPDDGAKIMFLGGAASPTDDHVIYGGGGSTEMRLVSGGGSSSGFGFYTNITTGAAFGNIRPTPIVKIDGGGNVGIGTPTPEAKLHVLSTSPIGGTLNSEVLITRFSTNVANQQSLDLKLRKYSTTDNAWWGNSLRLQRNIDNVVNSSYIDFGASETNLGAGSHELGFGVGNTEYMRISGSGNVGIGTAAPDAKLAVKGTIHANEVKVDLNVTGPDYVFESDYNLPSLDSIKTYIDQNKHLPDVPSAKEMEKNGVKIGEMNMLLLKKIEELTLYVIQQNKKIEVLGNEVKELKNKK